MNVDLKEEKPLDFGRFLSTHGLFSIKIKVSFNAEIFLMRVPYRLIDRFQSRHYFSIGRHIGAHQM